MKVPRFRVATCEGYRIKGSDPRRPSGNAEPGLSATVCDTLNLWREVKTYRSEDRLTGMARGVVRGKAGAVKDAEDHAAYLNEVHRRELHADAVRAGRAAVRTRG